MSGHRLERVADEIRAALSEALLRRMSDPRARLATVAAVRVSPDMRHARVWVGWIGPEHQRDEAVELLNRAAGFLRREIGKTLRLKYLPRLRFVPDEQEEHAARIHRALDDLHGDGAGDDGPHGDDPDPEDPR